MLKSLDNSNGIQYYGGNDPAKMGGRFKKGGGRGVDGATSPAKRSAVGQRSSVESRFGAVAGNIAKNQAILRNPNSTQQERDKAKRLITRNAGLARTGTALKGGANDKSDPVLKAVRSYYF